MLLSSKNAFISSKNLFYIEHLICTLYKIGLISESQFFLLIVKECNVFSSPLMLIEDPRVQYPPTPFASPTKVSTLNEVFP